jgi:hypothetical protein
MFVICLHCKKMVGCADQKGRPIDNCYHCKTSDCHEQILIGDAIITEVMVAHFESCLQHDSPHCGFKLKQP